MKAWPLSFLGLLFLPCKLYDREQECEGERGRGFYAMDGS